MINLKHLQTFLTIVDEGGFISAAQKLHKSQPTITATIKQLETLLGFDLFDRSSYYIKLTPSGERFYDEAQTLMTNYVTFEHRVDLIQHGIEANVHIDWDIALDFTPYITLLDALSEQYPQTRIHLENHHFSACKKRLLTGDTDLCLAVYEQQAPNIESFPIAKITMIAVSNPEYYAAHKNNVLMQIMIGGTQEPLSQLGVIPLSPNAPRCLVKDMHTAKALILSSLGVGRLPEHLIRDELASGELIALPKKHFAPAAMSIHCMRIKEKALGQFATSLWESLQEKRQH